MFKVERKEESHIVCKEVEWKEKSNIVCKEIER
jgi:hypothetical protein